MVDILGVTKTCIVILFLVTVANVLFRLVLRLLGKPVSLHGKHVMITGGSSGIGKWCAIEVVKRGASVTLLARDLKRLDEAKIEVEKYCVDKIKQEVVVRSIDISGDYAPIEKCVQQSEEKLGPISVLVNCAGFAIAARLEDTQIEDIRRLMDVNFMGSCFVTRAVVPSMKSQNWGRIVFTSSQAGLLGVYGYAAYSASKFALRGFAETLRAEVKPYNVQVTIAFPPDTDTPGFAEEEKTKPTETRLISESSGLVKPELVAKTIVNDLLLGKFFSTLGMDGKVLSIVCAGMAPFSTVLDLLIQIFCMPILRIVAVFMLYNFDRIVSKCRQKKDHDKKSH